MNLIFSNKINNSDYFFLNADNQINQYDAYVIAGDTEEDKLFLETMKSNLESSAFNLRLYIKSRDGPGDFDHQKESEIIMNRYVCLFWHVLLSIKKSTENAILSVNRKKK